MKSLDIICLGPYSNHAIKDLPTSQPIKTSHLPDDRFFISRAS